MITKWIPQGASDEELMTAARLLREEQVVAFPTETVYGLGAWAMSESGVARIYEAKGRPSDNPLIVHVYPGCDLSKLAKGIDERARKLMDVFWPGPLTLLFHKTEAIPDRTTGGLKTVGLRMPSNPVAIRLLKLADVPVAAPSANTSGRPSPTTAQHVMDDMEGRIPCIVDGGPCTYGVESTILDMTSEPPMLLRPGAVTKEQIEALIGPITIDPAVAKGLAIDPSEHPRAPGMKYRHYAPKGNMVLVEGSREEIAAYMQREAAEAQSQGHKVGIMGSSELLKLLDTKVFTVDLGSHEDPVTMASRLFAGLRTFDDEGCDFMMAEAFEVKGVEAAIMNRMQRAAAGQIIKTEQEK